MAGIKIVDLPNSTLPYTGTERIPITQNGQTRNGTLNSLANYISAFTPPEPPLTQNQIQTAITNKSTFLTNIGAVSGNGAGITDASAFRESIKAQSTDIGFLNRFGRLADTTAVANGSTPEVGENIYMVWGSGSANPTVVNEALEAAAGTLIYYGANVPTPDHKISLTVWAELRLNASWNGSGVTAPDLTFGINATAWNSTLGLAGFLNSPQCFHGQVRSTGAINANPFNEAPSIDGDDGTADFDAQSIGKKFPIRIEIDGTANVCRMTVAGRTRVFRNSRYSRMVGTETSGFFVEWGAPDVDTQYYWCVHTIAVNAPELEDSPTFEGGSYGRLLHDLQTRGTTTLGGILNLFQNTTGAPYQAFLAGSRLGVGGTSLTNLGGTTNRINGGDVCIDGRLVASVGVNGYGSGIAPTVIDLNHTVATTGSDTTTVEKTLKTLAVTPGMTVGDMQRIILRGYATGAGNKRIRIQMAGADSVDSGTFTEAGQWEIFIDRAVLTSMSHTMVCGFEMKGGTTKVFPDPSTTDANHGAVNVALVCLTTTTDVGAVTLYFANLQHHRAKLT